MINPQQRIKGKIESGRVTPDVDFGTHFSNSLRSAQRNGIMSKASRSFNYWYQNRNSDGTAVLTPQEANEKFPASVKYDAPVTETVAKLKHREYLKNVAESSLTEAAHKSSSMNYIATLGGGFAGSMTDPIEASVGLLAGALSSVSRPILGLTSGIKNPALRTITRGTAFGVAEGAAVEPLYWMSSSYNNEAYGAVDTLANIAFSGTFGGGFAGMRSLIGDFDPSNIALSCTDKVKQVNSISEYLTIGKRTSEWNPTSKQAILSTPEAKAEVENVFKKKQEEFPDLKDDPDGILYKDAEMEVYNRLKTEVQKVNIANNQKEPDKSDPVEPARTDEELSQSSKQQADEYDDELNEYTTPEERIQAESQIDSDGEEVRQQRDTVEKQTENTLDVDVAEATVRTFVSQEFPAIEAKSILDDDVSDWLKKKGNNPRGFVYKGKYYFNPNRLRTPERIVSNVLHEAVGHIGLRAYFENPKEFKQYIEYIKRNYGKEVDSWKNKYKVNKTDEAAEEIHAIASENDIIIPPLVQVIYKKTLNKFKKTTNRSPSPYEDVLIRENIYQGFKRVRNQRIENYINSFADVKELDDEYLEAVNNKDWKKVSYLVNRAAQAAGYTEGIVYHGSGKQPLIANKFDKSFLGTRTGAASAKQGFFASTDRVSAESYMLNQGWNEPKSYGEKNNNWIYNEKEGGELYALYVKSENPKHLYQKDYTKREHNFSKEAKQAFEKGHDVLIIHNTSDNMDMFTLNSVKGEEKFRQSDVYIAKEPNALKSAKLITRDDKKNIIPLSKRFDISTDDLRFQRETPDIEARSRELNQGAITRANKGLISSEATLKTLNEVQNNSVYDNIVDGNLKLKAQKHNQIARVRPFNDIVNKYQSDQWAEVLQHRVEEITPSRIKALKSFFITRYAKDIDAFLEKHNASHRDLNQEGISLDLEIAAKYSEMKAMGRESEVQKPSDIGMDLYNIFAKYKKEQIDMLNRSGGAMRFKEGHTVKQSHNAEKIASVAGVKRKRFDGKTMRYKSDPKDKEKAFDVWFQDITRLGIDEKRMDKEGVFDTYKQLDTDNNKPIQKSYLNEYLIDVFNGVWDGKQGDSSASAPGGIIKKKSAKRNIHFTTGKASYEYRMKYGIEDTQAAILMEFEEMATNITLLQDWGSSYRYNYESIVDALIKASDIGDAATKTRLKKLKKIGEKDFDIIDGSAKDTDHMTLKSVVNSLRVASNVARMGGLFFTSQSDVAFAKYALRRFDIKGQKTNDYFGIYRPRNEAEKKALKDNLAMLEALEGAAASRLDPDSLDINSSMAWLQHKFFTVNGMNWWNKHVREAMLLGMMRRLGVASNYSMKQLEEMGGDSADFRALMKKYDIDDKEWDLFRNQARYIDKENGQITPNRGQDESVYLTVDMIDDINPEDIRAMLASKGRRAITGNVVQKELDRLKAKLGGMMRAEMDRGVLTPGVREWRVLNFGTEQGSWQNIMIKLLTQYKSFPLAMWNKNLTPAYREGKIGSFITYSVMAASISLLVQQAKDALTGKQVRPWNDFKLYSDAVARSGGLSFAMDMINKDWTNSGMEGGFTEFLGGPTLDMASDFIGMAYQSGKAIAYEDETDKLGIKVSKFLKDWTPGANIPILQQMYRSLIIYNMMDYFDDKTLRRSESWLKRELGQEYWYGSPTDRNKSLTIEDIFFNTLKNND